jgi:hypothetical protein
MEKIILLIPVILGAVLICIGLFLFIRRTRTGIHIDGIVTGTAKSIKKHAGVKVTTEAPIVKYEVAGQIYNVASAKFYTESTAIFRKGKSISIRVDRKNHRSFELAQKGDTSEKILICCGIFMIAAVAIMYFRYY